MRTVVFLDVDGVLVPEAPVRPVGVASTDFGAAWAPAWIRDDVVTAVAAWGCRKVWLTTREEGAAEAFGAALGFTEYLSGHDSMTGPTTWWKADALIEFLRAEAATGGPFTAVWIDDELGEAAEHGDVAAVQAVADELGCRLIILCPDPALGLTGTDLEELNAHIGATRSDAARHCEAERRTHGA